MDTSRRQRFLTLIAIALTFVSGATDVAAFTRLGGVFASVQTGNIVLWGLAVARGSAALTEHAATSIAGYVAGVAISTWIGHWVKQHRAEDPEADADAGVLPGHVVWMLAGELTLIAGLAVGWEVSGASPAGWPQFALLATVAAVMGMQSAAALDMGLSHVATTYLTGTLTGLVSSLASPGQDTPLGLRRIGVLLGLATGAGLSGLLIRTAAGGVPALPLAGLITALALAIVPGWRDRRTRNVTG